MGVPKRRVSHARQGERRAHLAIDLPNLEECPHCHERSSRTTSARTAATTTAAWRSRPSRAGRRRRALTR